MVADVPARLTACCRAADAAGTGRLRPHELVAALRAADFGISLHHILSILRSGQ